MEAGGREKGGKEIKGRGKGKRRKKREEALEIDRVDLVLRD